MKTVKERAKSLRQLADQLEAEERKRERLKHCDTIPTCQNCGSRRFTVQAYTIVGQTLSFDDDGDSDWEDDYQSGDHTDIWALAECAECEADAEDVLERFGHTFYDDPRPKEQA